jgi:hypothetical protein
MKIRLVKQEQQAVENVEEKGYKKQLSESDLTETVQSWVKEFKSRKFTRRTLTIHQAQGTGQS